MKHTPFLALAVAASLAVCLLSCAVPGSAGSPRRNDEMNVERIWDEGYSAFPSIVRYRGAMYVCFREGVSHIFDENGIAAGKTRILRSRDGRHWKSVALLSKEGYDLRDPKLSVTPDGRLMVMQGGSVYVDKKLVDRVSQVSLSMRLSSSTSTGTPVSSFSPSSRAGMTLVWLITITSPGRR